MRNLSVRSPSSILVNSAPGGSLMHTVRVVTKTEAGGSLSLRIPLGRPEADYEVLVIVQPMAAPGQTPE